MLGAACDDDERQLTVFAAASLTDAFGEIGAAFEQAHVGVDVRFSFGGSQRLRLQLEQGAEADVFASADARQIELAEAAGALADGAAAFAANRLVLVVPADNPAGVGELGDLAAGGVRLVVAGPEVPAGRLTRDVLAALGAEDVLDAVVSEEDSVRRVLTKVEVGEADAGFVYSTDAMIAGDAVTVVPFDDGGLRNDYFIAVTRGAADAALARSFLDFVRGAEAQRLLAEAGFVTAAGGDQ